MKSGPFIKCVAEVLGIDPKTLAVVSRAMREAGYLSSGARGVNAPHMTPLDAARIILAAMTGETPTRAVRAFEFYRNQRPYNQCSENLPWLCQTFELAENHTVEKCLERMVWCWESREFMDTLADKQLELVMSFRLHECSLNIVAQVGEFRTVYSPETEVDWANARHNGLRVTREVSGVELQKIGEAIAAHKVVGA